MKNNDLNITFNSAYYVTSANKGRPCLVTSIPFRLTLFDEWAMIVVYCSDMETLVPRNANMKSSKPVAKHGKTCKPLQRRS